MENQNELLRYIVLFSFKKTKISLKQRRNFFSVLGKEVVSVHIVQRWFTKFRSGNFSVQDLHRSGRPPRFKMTKSKCYSMKIPNTLQIAHSSVIRQIGYVSRLNVWIPHDVTEAQPALYNTSTQMNQPNKTHVALLSCPTNICFFIHFIKDIVYIFCIHYIASMPLKSYQFQPNIV